MMAYLATGCAAHDIAHDIHRYRPGIDAIFIYSDADAKILVAYEKTLERITLMLQRASDLDARYAARGGAPFTKEQQCDSKSVDTGSGAGGPYMRALALPDITSVVGSAFQLMSYFRPNVDFSTQTTTIGDDAMISQVFDNLRAEYGYNHIKLYNLSGPISVRPGDLSTYLANSNLYQNLTTLLTVRSTLAAHVTTLDHLTRQRQNKAKCSSIKDEDTIRLANEIQQLNDFAAPQKALLADIDALTKELITDDGAQKSNALTDYLRLESMHPMMDTYSEAAGPAIDRQVYWLSIKSVVAGGNTRIKSKSIIEVFTGGYRMAQSGGAIVNYNLYDHSGRSVLSNTIVHYLKYRNPRQIASTVCN